MDNKLFFKTLINSFSYPLTNSQTEALRLLSDFLLCDASKSSIFLLKGYAGTGKTSIINCLVNNLSMIHFESVLLAPTGRAAKVMSILSKKQASTIHRHIYYLKNNQANHFYFYRKPNKSCNTLFIVDEASMITDTPSSYSTLLDDLIQYVYSGVNCKLLFIGDTAQLPPIQTDESPALNAQHLALHYAKNSIETELTQVVRQKLQSGILGNATQIRNSLCDSSTKFLFNTKKYQDIRWLKQSTDIQETIQQAYEHDGIENTIIIVNSNKRAVLYNKQIRKVILNNENELSCGDLLMVVRNNYYWLKDSQQINFIANGDTIKILEIHYYEEWYGFRFAKVKALLTDYPEQPPFNTILLLDTLHCESPCLSTEEYHRLYQEIMRDYADEPTTQKQQQKTKENPYFNALQVKYSYTITCHKSQGGQWKNVFIEKPYFPNKQEQNYLRWLYTALTRATQNVYLIGYKKEDFVTTE